MRHKALTLAVAALLAFGASGLAAASISPSPTVTTADQSPADTASSANHTVEVIDPNDQLSEQDVENAWQLAWAEETVRNYFDEGAPVHFHVEAVGDELQVYVAPNSSATPQVQAVVDLNSKSIDNVEELNNVLTAEEVNPMELSPINDSNVDSGETIIVEALSKNGTSSEAGVSVGEEFSATVITGDAESGTISIYTGSET